MTNEDKEEMKSLLNVWAEEVFLPAFREILARKDWRKSLKINKIVCPVNFDKLTRE